MNTSQLQSFQTLVHQINEIPNVKISLEAKKDHQRDAIAFIVDEIFNQHQENGKLIVEGFVNNIKKWNTPPNSTVATTEIFKMMAHLYEARIASLQAQKDLSDEEKTRYQAMHSLFENLGKIKIQQATKQNLPVNLAGIPETFLPQWYTDNYIKN